MTSLIIVAAGSSSRLGGSVKKEYLPLGEGTVLSTSITPFMDFDISNVAIVIPKTPTAKSDAINALKKDPKVFSWLNDHNLIFVPGGESRQHSVFNALNVLNSLNKNTPNTTNNDTFTNEYKDTQTKQPCDTLTNNSEIKNDNFPNNNDIVLIHDGARPFVTRGIICAVINATNIFGSAAPATNAIDTQKIVDENNFIKEHLLRENIRCVQTPQGFLFSKLLYAHKNAIADGFFGTDDTQIWGRYEISPTKIIPGSYDNFKITYQEDYKRALSNFYAKINNDTTLTNPADKNYDTTNNSKNRTFQQNITIGFGYDLHRLSKGRDLIIGGVKIPYEKGEVGHSDGDALIHSIIDSLLGASHLGDIGELFPPGDNKWLNASSIELLKIVWQKVTSASYTLGNIDCVVKLEKPKLLPYRKNIILSIANALNIDPNRVFVKAKTAEGLGDVGKSEAIESFCTAILYKTQDIKE